MRLRFPLFGAILFTAVQGYRTVNYYTGKVSVGFENLDDAA
ncbi:unnamed protein product, partial [Mesorhabditis spiculigera]